MENEKIKVVIFDCQSNDVTLIELTPEQLKLLDWLDCSGFLDDYNIIPNVQFQSI